MSSSSQRIAKNASILMASQLVTWVLSLLLMFIQPRWLGDVALGELHVAQSTWLIAAVVILFGMDVLLMKEIARAPDQASKLYSTSLVLQIPLFVVGFALVAITSIALGYDTVLLQVIMIVGLSQLIWQFALTYRAALVGLEQMAAISYAEIAGKVINTFVGITLLLMGYGVIAMAWVSVGMATANFLIQWLYLRRISTFTFNIDLDYAKYLLKEGTPYMLSALFVAAYTQADAILMKQLLSTEAVGWYSASDRIFGTMLFVPTAFIGAAFPAMSRMFQDERDALPLMMRRSFNLMVLLGVPVGLGLMAMAQPIVNLVYDEEFYNSGLILAVMGVVVLLMYLTTLMGRFLIANDRQNTWTKIMAVATIATFGLDFLLIPLAENFLSNGAVGGALAYVFTETGMLIAGILLMPKGSLDRSNLWLTIRAITAGLLMVAAVWPVRNWFMDTATDAPLWFNGLILLPILVGAVVYAALIYFFKLIPEDEWRLVVDLLPERLKRLLPSSKKQGRRKKRGPSPQVSELTGAVAGSGTVYLEQAMMFGNRNKKNKNNDEPQRKGTPARGYDGFMDGYDELEAVADEFYDQLQQDSGRGYSAPSQQQFRNELPPEAPTEYVPPRDVQSRRMEPQRPPQRSQAPRQEQWQRPDEQPPYRQEPQRSQRSERQRSQRAEAQRPQRPASQRPASQRAQRQKPQRAQQQEPQRVQPPPQQRAQQQAPQRMESNREFSDGGRRARTNGRDEYEQVGQPPARQERQRRPAAPHNDGSSRDQAIREVPPGMEDMFGAAPQQNGSGRNGSAPQAPQQRREAQRPAPPERRIPPQEQFDGVIGAPASRDVNRGQRPQRPARPMEQNGPNGRISRRDGAANGYSQNGQGYNGQNGLNGHSPNGRQNGQMVPQEPPSGIRFEPDPNENYSDAGYGGSFKDTSKKKKKKRSRRKKHKRDSVMLNDQKQDVNQALELWDDNGHKLMHFSAEVIDNLRHMTTRLTATTGEIPKRIGLVSSLPGEGVTYVARALATVMAHDLSARVAYVDLNWWSAGVPAFAPPTNQGLVSVVTGDKRLDEIFVSTQLPNLTLIPAGKLERGDRPIMARSNVLASAMKVLNQHFDYLVLDLPAIRATNDAVPLAALTNGVVLVVKQGETPNEAVRLALDEVEHLKMLGVMLNQVNYKTPEFIRRVIPQD